MCIFAVTFILAKTQFISLSSKNSDALQLFHKLSLDQATVYYPKNNDRCSPEIPFQRCTVRQIFNRTISSKSFHVHSFFITIIQKNHFRSYFLLGSFLLEKMCCFCLHIENRANRSVDLNLYTYQSRHLLEARTKTISSVWYLQKVSAFTESQRLIWIASSSASLCRTQLRRKSCTYCMVLIHDLPQRMRWRANSGQGKLRIDKTKPKDN